MILLYRSLYTKYSIKQKQTIEHGVEANSVWGYLEQIFKIIVYVVSVHCCVILSEIKEIINYSYWSL